MKNHIDKEWLDNHKISWFIQSMKWNIWKQIDAKYLKFSEFNIESIQMETWKKLKVFYSM